MNAHPQTHLILAVVIAIGVADCTSSPEREGNEPSRLSSSPHDGVEVSSSVAVGAAASLVAGRAAAIAAGQRTASDRYRVLAVPGSPDGVLGRARCPDQRLSTTFMPAGPVLRIPAMGAGSSAEIGVTLAEVRRGGGEVGPPSVVGRRVDGNEVVYERSGVDEWYLNGPLGLEQGFVLRESPTGDGPLVIELDIDGELSPELDGETVALVDAVGIPRARYGFLFATDATDREVPSELAVIDGRIAITAHDDGAVFPIRVDPLYWVESANLTANDAANADGFGFSVSLSDDGATVLAGAPSDDDLGSGSGSAYVFQRAGGTWQQQAKLTANDGGTSDFFGHAVSISGDGKTALISAPSKAGPAGLHTGGAYVFTRNGSVWTQQAQLFALDGDPSDFLGDSVSLSEDGSVALIGVRNDADGGVASGSAYVFVRNAGVWSQEAKLTASDATEGALFGEAVSLSDDGAVALIGAPESGNLDMIGIGAAYVFVKNSTWLEYSKLVPSDGQQGDRFGHGAALSGDGASAVLGAPGADHGGVYGGGAAYWYVFSSNAWSEQGELVVSNPKPGVGFGYAASMSGSGDAAIVGAPGKGYNSGGSHVFSLNGGSASLEASFSGSTFQAAGWLGATVSMSANGTSAVVGAWSDGPGSATIVRIGGTVGEPCSDDDGCLGYNCVDDVCCDSACGDDSPNDCLACSSSLTGGIDGTCASLPAGSACGNGTSDECTAPDTCNAAGSCMDNDAAAGTPCGDQGFACAIDDACDGSGACIDNGFQPPTTVCRTAVGLCDVEEMCTGTDAECPADSLEDKATPCRAAVGPCDVVETCDGALPTCPEDEVAPAGVLCREASDGCDLDETCDGSSVACPEDAAQPDGAACDDGDVCTAHDTCLAGTCQPGDIVCEDGQGGSGEGGGNASNGADGAIVINGCGCHTGRRPGPTRSVAWLSVLALLGLVQRRKRT